MAILETVQKRFKTAEENQSKKFDKFNGFDYIFNSRLKHFDPNIPSKVFNPILWSFIETIVTRMLSKNPVINYKPREQSDTNQAQILGDLFSYWFDKSNAYPTIVSWVKDALIYGTGILKVDWLTSEPRKVKSYQFDEAGMPLINEEDSGFATLEDYVTDYDDPRITNVNIYDFFFDPRATSMFDAKWVIHQYWVDIKDLERENKNAEQFEKVIYNKAALRRLKASKVSESEYEKNRKRANGYDDTKNDETVDRVKIWEMWEDNRCVIIADESEILRDETNYYWHGKKPFIRIVDSIVPHEFYGKGEIEPVEKQLHALNTTQNQRITNVNRILSPTWVANDQVDDSELQFIDNNIIHVTQRDDVDMLQMPNVTQTAVEEQNVITDTIQRALGVTDYVQGIQTPGQTAKEVEVKTSQANARFAHKVKLFEEMGLQPLGEFIYKLYQQFTTKEKVIRVVGKQGDNYITLTPADLAGNYDVIPESDSTLETDQTAEFTKFLNLFQIVQPYFKRNQVDPITGRTISSGYLEEQEFVKELIDRSGEKDPDRYFGGTNGQNPTISGQVSGSNAGAPEANSGFPNSQVTGVEGLQPAGQF